MANDVTLRFGTDLADLRRGLDEGVAEVREGSQRMRAHFADLAERTRASYAGMSDAARVRMGEIANSFRNSGAEGALAELERRLSDLNEQTERRAIMKSVATAAVIAGLGYAAYSHFSDKSAAGAAESTWDKAAASISHAAGEATARLGDLSAKATEAVGAAAERASSEWTAIEDRARTAGTAVSAELRSLADQTRSWWEQLGNHPETLVAQQVLDLVRDAADQLGAGLQRPAQKAIELGEAFDRMSQSTGTSIGDLAALRTAAAEAGVQEGTLRAALNSVRDALDAQDDGSNRAREALKAMGVSLEGLTAKDWRTVWVSTANALSSYADSAEKAKLANALFGNSGAELIPMFNRGGAAMAAYLSEARRLGVEMDAATARHAAALQEIDRANAVAAAAQKARVDAARVNLVYALRTFADDNKSVAQSVRETWDGALSELTARWQNFRENWLPNWMGGLDQANSRGAAVRKDGGGERQKTAPDAPPDTKAGEILQNWREELDRIKDAETNLLSYTKAKELEYWQSKLATTRAGSREYQLVLHQVAQLKREVAREALDNTVLELRGEQEAVAKNGADKLAIQRKIADQVKAAYGSESSQYRQEQLKVEALEREHGQQMLRLKLAELEASGKLAAIGFEREQQEVKHRRELGQMTELDELRRMREIDDKKRTAEVAAAQDRLALIRRNNGRDIEEIERAERQISETRARHALERQRQLDQEEAARVRTIRDLGRLEADSRIQVAREIAQSEQESLAFRREMGRIGAVEEVQQLRKVENERHRIEMAARREKAAMIKGDVVATRQANIEIEQLERQHNLRMTQLARQEAMARRNAIREWTQPLKDATHEMVNGMIHGTLTMKQLAANALTSIAAKYAEKGLEMVEDLIGDWIMMEIEKTAITEGEAATRETIETAAAVAAGVDARAAALAEISAYAAAGAAAAMASVAAIPYIGWAMAPGVGAEHYAMAMSFATSLAVPSAAGGWMVPQDTLAMVHEDERILPARYSRGLDRLVDDAANGGSPDAGAGGGITFHYAPNVQAMDSRGVERVLANNAKVLVKVLKQADRNFVPGSRRGAK